MAFQQVCCFSHVGALQCYMTSRAHRQKLATWHQTGRWGAAHFTCLATQATEATDDRSTILLEDRLEDPERQVTLEQSIESASGRNGAAQPEEPTASDRPGSSSEAIQRGIEALNAKRPQEAIELFQAALELPGNGFMRFAGTVREYRCPSEGEEQAALYNMACAYAALSQRDSALACLQGAFEAGLSDFAAVRSDPDLNAIRGRIWINCSQSMTI